MTMPGVHDFAIYAGDSVIKKFQYFEDEAATKPIPLHGARLHLQARPTIYADEAPIDLLGIVDDPAQGAFHFEFPKAVTTALVSLQDAVPLVYDLEFTQASGVVKTLARGTLTIHKDVTHDQINRRRAAP